jgi:hypothetical protein
MRTWILFMMLLCAAAPARAESIGRGGVTSAAGLRGWMHAGNRPLDYEVSADRAVAHSGKSSARMKAAVANPEGFGSLMQICKADRWRGKRVRLSAFVKSDGVRHAALWMRVDGNDRDGGHWLAFDNMQDRPIVGATGWTRYDLVLDVAAEATQLAFGATLSGPGAIWVDDLELEEVPKSVPTTGPFSPSALSEAPQNLGFED